MIEHKPAEIMPKGARRPWHPRFTCPVAIEPGAADNEITLRVVGPVTRHRVGIRRWIKSITTRDG